MRVRELIRDTKTNKITQVDKNKGYYMHCDEGMEINYSHSAQKNIHTATR